MTFEEMLAQAEACDEMANRTFDILTNRALREASSHWRTMATQMELLKRDPVYRIICDRK